MNWPASVGAVKRPTSPEIASRILFNRQITAYDAMRCLAFLEELECLSPRHSVGR